MTLLLSSLAVLVTGAVLSVLLVRLPRQGLLTAMTAIVVSSILAIIAALDVLLGFNARPDVLRWPMPLGAATLAMDGLSAWFVLTVAVLGAAVAIYSSGYMRGELDHASGPLFSFFLSVMMASIHLMICAADAVLFLVGWEVMTVSAFFLVNLHDSDEGVRRGAWMYIVATHLGTAIFLLPMFALIVARGGGSTTFADFAAALSSSDPTSLAVLFILGLVGFGTKAGFMPMHVWLPNAHPVAPTPVSALLSGVAIKAGIYGLLRLLTWLPPLPAGCAIVMLVMGMISGVLGVLYALAQHDLKRLLAYHSVENIGIIGLGIGMGMLGQTLGCQSIAVIGYAGAMLHVLNHALFKGLLFLSAGTVIHSTGTGAIDRLGGLSRRMPVNAALFLVAAVAICGLPPLNGFVSEWLIYGSLFRGASLMSGAPASVAVLALTSLALMGGLALTCFAKVFGVVFLGEARDSSVPCRRAPAAMIAGMAILAGLCIVIGVVPSLVVPLIAKGAATVVHMAPGSLADSLRASLVPTWMLSMLTGLFVLLVVMLVVIRGRTTAVVPMFPAPTWGCGYATSSARVQYTASSFAWSLISSFSSLLWPQRHVRRPIGPFPGHSELETHTPDAAETDLFAPIFRLVARISRMIKTVSWSGQPFAAPRATEDPIEYRGPVRLVFAQAIAAVRRGSIQICVTYIALALLVLFVIEVISFGKSMPDPANPPQQVVSDAGRIHR